MGLYGNANCNSGTMPVLKLGGPLTSVIEMSGKEDLSSKV